jgi:hypothetical protein
VVLQFSACCCCYWAGKLLLYCRWRLQQNLIQHSDLQQMSPAVLKLPWQLLVPSLLLLLLLAQ